MKKCILCILSFPKCGLVTYLVPVSGQKVQLFDINGTPRFPDAHLSNAWRVPWWELRSTYFHTESLRVEATEHITNLK